MFKRSIRRNNIDVLFVCNEPLYTYQYHIPHSLKRRSISKNKNSKKYVDDIFFKRFF